MGGTIGRKTLGKVLIFTLLLSLCSSSASNSTSDDLHFGVHEIEEANFLGLEPALLPHQSLSDNEKRRLLEDVYRKSQRSNSKSLEHEKMISSR